MSLLKFQAYENNAMLNVSHKYTLHVWVRGACSEGVSSVQDQTTSKQFVEENWTRRKLLTSHLAQSFEMFPRRSNLPASK